MSAIVPVNVMFGSAVPSPLVKVSPLKAGVPSSVIVPSAALSTRDRRG